MNITKILIIVQAISMSTFSSLGQNTWVQKTSIFPPSRGNGVGFSMGNKGYLAGGAEDYGTSSTCQQDFQEFDPATNTWVKKAELPHKIMEAATFTIGSKVYITTGMDDSSHWVNGILIWDTLQNNWTVIPDVPPEIKRICAVGFSIGDKGYIGLGSCPWYMGAFGLQKDIREYDPVNNTWTRKADFPGVPRASAVSFVIGNKAFVTTGWPTLGELEDTIPTNDLWEFDPAANTWIQKATFPGGIMRGGAVGFTIGSRSYIATGVGVDFLPWYTDCWEYDAELDKWTSMGRFPGNIRAWAVGFTINDKGYLATGDYFGLPQWTDVWEYTPFPVGMIDKNNPEVTFSPNPVKNIATLNFKDPMNGNLTLMVHDLTGRVVFTDRDIKKQHSFEKSYDLQKLGSGVYLYIMTINDRVVARGKLIKE